MIHLLQMRSTFKLVIPVLIVSVIAGVIVLAFASGFYLEKIPTEAEVASELILSRTNALPEVQTFLGKYPDAWVDPRGMDHFAAEYHINTADLTNQTLDYTYPYSGYLKLQVGLDGKGFPTQTALWCTNQKFGQQKIHVNGDNIHVYLDSEMCRIL